jgi:hypothetical protein
VVYPPPGVDVDRLEGLLLWLTEAQPEAASRTVTPPARADQLGAAAIAKIFDRLPPLASELGDQVAFAFRERSLPPPRTGQTVAGTFPPPPPAVGPGAVAPPGPLTVRRHQPEGDVPIAPNLSVTFDQPMVAVTSQDEAAQVRPVTLTPEPPGAWRWVGTKTLLFEPKPRFPMATEYRVEIPAGTRSALGGVLAEPVTWTFRTPAAKVVSFFPGEYGTQVLDVPMFLGFDQRVDPDTVLSLVTAKAGSESLALRLLSEAEVSAHETLASLRDRSEPGRWLAFRPTVELPRDAMVYVTVAAGVPSLEGPRKTSEPVVRRFRTYAPLRITEHRCTWRGKCPPGATMSIRFSNSLDETAFDRRWLTVTPEVPGLDVTRGGNMVYLNGRTRGRTTYTVTVSPAVVDVHGQTLGQSAPLTFEYGSAAPFVTSTAPPVVVLEPGGPATLPVYSVNLPKLKAELYHVGPQDYPKWLQYQRAYQNDKKVPRPPGKRVAALTLKPGGEADELVETAVPLAKGLGAGGFGQLLVVVEPAKQAKDRWEHRRVHHWVQVTSLALDAFVDHGELIAWATSLADGAPVGAAELSFAGVAPQSSDDAGLARFALPKASKSGVGVLVARKGDDLALLPESQSRWWSDSDTRWVDNQPGEVLRWYVVDDRAMYKPKESVHLKGWIRRLDRG